MVLAVMLLVEAVTLSDISGLKEGLSSDRCRQPSQHPSIRPRRSAGSPGAAHPRRVKYVPAASLPNVGRSAWTGHPARAAVTPSSTDRRPPGTPEVLSRARCGWARFAVRTGRWTGWLSRRAGLGAGSIIGGRVTLFLDRGALNGLAAGRRVVLVSGTNGKTTTSHLLAAALRSTGDPVAHNASISRRTRAASAERSGTNVPSQSAMQVSKRRSRVTLRLAPRQ